MTSSHVYVDTSLYLGILLGESEARPAVKLLSKKILCSSVLLLIETERNLVRLSRENILSSLGYRRAINQLQEDKEKFVLKDVTIDLCLTGRFPPVKLPRSSDLIHLRTALWYHENGGLDAFLTLDIHQRESAQDFGLSSIEF